MYLVMHYSMYLYGGDGIDTLHQVLLLLLHLCGNDHVRNSVPDSVGVAVEPAGADGQSPPAARDEGRDA